MNQIDIVKILEQKSFLSKYPAFLKTVIIKIIRKVLLINEINKILTQNEDKYNISFIDELFSYLDFSFKISQKDIENIPAEGKVIIVANHPLGALDALAIIKAISKVRRDIKVIANDVLANINNIKDLIISANTFDSSIGRESYSKIEEAIKNDEAILFFPAGEVSRLKWINVKDKKWQKGAIRFSQKFHAPVLPVYVDSKNTILFYIASLFYKNMSTLLLPREVFNKKGETITLHIDAPIPARAFTANCINIKQQAQLLKKHVYALKNGKKKIFKTEQNIIHPVNIKIIKKELLTSPVLGKTPDCKTIYLVSYYEAENTIREIARLRELTFRRIGEGTGNKLDIDKYDKIYRHIVLWDDDNLEIVGSYRVGFCKDLINKQDISSLYTASLFKFSPEFINKYLYESVELGRSFVQKKYWNTSSLDYLWQGIGSLLAANPEIKYLYGGVSLSNSFHIDAKNSIIFFYKKYFSCEIPLAKSNNTFILNAKEELELSRLFSGNNIKEDYIILKKYIKNFGHSVPPLYKHYTDLCEEGGVKFLDFGVDPEFGNCIDGLILVEISKIKNKKQYRYIKKDSQTVNATIK